MNSVGVGVFSNDKRGRFYPFDYVLPLPSFPDAGPQAIGLAVDAQDRLYTGITIGTDVKTLSNVKQKNMHAGIWVSFPDRTGRMFFTDFVPSHQSPVYLIAAHGKIYVTVGAVDPLGNNKILLGALDEW